MIDIHNHSLFGVDDGAGSLDESIAMIQDAYKQGIDVIVLTPHYRHGIFSYPSDEIREHYNLLCQKVSIPGLRLCLGCEYHVNSEIIDNLKSGRCLTLGSGQYVLVEYSMESEYFYICNTVRDLLLHGYIPVIAHIERYSCLLDEPELCGELRKMGALLQVNADSILGHQGRKITCFCKRILKIQLVDLVASDAHDMVKRANHLRDCFRYVRRKYGQDYAESLFTENAYRILTEDE